MTSFRRPLIFVGILLTFFVVACAGTPNTGASNTNANALATTPTATTTTAQNTYGQNNNQQIVSHTTPTTTNNQGQVSGQNNNQPQANNQQHNQMQDNNQQNKQSQDNNQTNNQPQTSNQQNNQPKAQMTPVSEKLVVKTKQVSLNGQTVTILTTFDGMTLYQRTSDRAPTAICSGPCAQVWPPLLSNGTVISTTPINGNLTIQSTTNGNQVVFNGHPLYTYAGDKAPGQVNGQGQGNVWQALTVTLRPQHW